MPRSQWSRFLVFRKSGGRGGANDELAGIDVESFTESIDECERVLAGVTVLEIVDRCLSNPYHGGELCLG